MEFKSRFKKKEESKQPSLRLEARQRKLNDTSIVIRNV